jgi:hypothetical protein
MTLYALAMAGLGALMIGGAVLEKEWVLQLLRLYGLGFIVTPMMANYFMSATVRR